jgi:hypothetical protein
MFPISNPIFTNVPLETAILVAVLGAVGTGLIIIGVSWFLLNGKLGKKRQIIYIPRKLRSLSSLDDEKQKEVKNE